MNYESNKNILKLYAKDKKADCTTAVLLNGEVEDLSEKFRRETKNSKNLLTAVLTPRH